MLKNYKEGQVILREGEDDSTLYKTVSGHVEVYVNYETEYETFIGILSSGAYFGEIGALTGSQSIYTVVAYGDSLIMEVDKNELNEYAKLNYRDMLSIMTNMAKTMVNLRANISLLTNDLFKLMEDNRSIKESQAIKERIRNSDITKQLIRYNIQMEFNNRDRNA